MNDHDGVRCPGISTEVEGKGLAKGLWGAAENTPDLNLTAAAITPYQ